MRLNPDLPAKLEEIINKALEKDRELRYQHASDIRADLKRLKRETESSSVSRAGGCGSRSRKQLTSSGTTRPPSSGKSEGGFGCRASNSGATKEWTRWKILVPAAVVLAAAMIGGGFYFRSRPATPLTEKDTIVLADFENTTGDAVFDDALKQALGGGTGAVPLSQHPLRPQGRRDSAADGAPASERVTQDMAREICLRTGSKAMLAGSISRLGSQYVVGLEAVNCGTGDTLAKEQAEAASKEDVLKALDKVASSLRTKLGESLASVQKFDVPIEATTPSLEALKTFSMGVRPRVKKETPRQFPSTGAPSSWTPISPMAYARPGGLVRQPRAAQPGRGESQEGIRADGAGERARETPHFRQLLLRRHRRTGEGSPDLRTVGPELSARPVPHGNLGANYAALGQYEKAVAETQEALRLEPDTRYELLQPGPGTNCPQSSGRRQDHLREGPQRTNWTVRTLRWWMYYLAFLRGDTSGMEQQLAWGAGKPGDEDPLLSAQSDTEAYYGRFAKATGLLPACGRFGTPRGFQGNGRPVAGECCSAGSGVWQRRGREAGSCDRFGVGPRPGCESAGGLSFGAGRRDRPSEDDGRGTG